MSVCYHHYSSSYFRLVSAIFLQEGRSLNSSGYSIICEVSCFLCAEWKTLKSIERKVNCGNRMKFFQFLFIQPLKLIYFYCDGSSGYFQWFPFIFWMNRILFLNQQLILFIIFFIYFIIHFLFEIIFVDPP